EKTRRVICLAKEQIRQGRLRESARQLRQSRQQSRPAILAALCVFLLVDHELVDQAEESILIVALAQTARVGRHLGLARWLFRLRVTLDVVRHGPSLESPVREYNKGWKKATPRN